MTETDRERLIRQYAAREITWRELRELGFDNYVEVLGALGELGLRPPVASMQGPNVAARERARAVVGERVDLVSTGDFLRELEWARLIQSSIVPLLRAGDRAARRLKNVSILSNLGVLSFP